MADSYIYFSFIHSYLNYANQNKEETEALKNSQLLKKNWQIL